MTDVEAGHNRPPQGELRYVVLEEIEPAEDNLRTHLTGIDELAQSIVAGGLHTALELTTNGDGKLKVVAGHRRYAAIKQAVEAALLPLSFPIPAIVRDHMGDADRIEAMVVENLQRQDLNPIEEARGFARLVEEFGCTQEVIAAKVGINQSNVSRRLALLQLPEQVQDAVARGRLVTEVAVALTKIGDPEAILELWERLGDSIRQSDIDRAIQRAQTERRRAKLQADCDKAGVRIIDRAELSGSYKFGGDSFKKAKEAKAWQDEHNPDGEDDSRYLVIAVDFNSVPEIRVMELQARVQATADDPEKRRQKVERLTQKYYLEAIEGLVAKAGRTVMVDMAFDVVLSHVSSYNARAIGTALGLEPIKREERSTDPATGEVKIRSMSDWPATVQDWASQSDKQRLQAVMATLLAGIRHGTAIQAFLDEHGIDETALRKQAERTVDGKDDTPA